MSAMREPPAEPIGRHVPGVERLLGDATSNWSGLSAHRATDRLGFQAAHTWERYLHPDGTPRSASGGSPGA